MTGRSRADRIGALIRKEMAVLLIEKVKDPRVSGITLCGIRMGKDLKSARLYFSVLGGPERREAAYAGLESAKGFLKRAIGERLGLRYVPEIVFEYDDTLEKGHRMEVLLERLKTETPGDASG